MAAPGVDYTARLMIEITTTTGKVLKEYINISYRKTGSTIGIQSYGDRLPLNPSNDYTNNIRLCVFSPFEKYFDVALESEHQGNFFLLRDKINNALPYSASISLNNTTSKTSFIPGSWLKGGVPVQARNFSECGGRSNVDIRAQIASEQALTVKPGKYTGVLTVRVRAR